MSPALRPMGTSQILDRTFEIYRSAFWTFSVLAGLPALAMMALEMANQIWWKLLPGDFGPRLFLWFTPQILLYQLVLAHGVILFNLMLCPLFSLVVSKCLFGERSTSMEAIAAGLERGRSWVGITISNCSLSLVLPEFLIAASLAGVAYLLFEVLKLDPLDPMQLGPRFLLAAFLIGWVIFQYLSAAFILSLPGWMLEKLTIRSSLRRGWRISQKSRMRIFIIRTVPIMIGWLITFTLGFVFSFLFHILFKHTSLSWVAHRRTITEISILLDCAVATFVGPMFPIALTLLYYDQRIRLEGYDIECMMDAAGMNALPTSAQNIVDSTSPTESFQ